jgi:hypothetical protein
MVNDMFKYPCTLFVLSSILLFSSSLLLYYYVPYFYLFHLDEWYSTIPPCVTLKLGVANDCLYLKLLTHICSIIGKDRVEGDDNGGCYGLKCTCFDPASFR